MARINRDRMMQLIGKRLIVTTGEKGNLAETTGTLTGVDGRTAKFDGGAEVWLPSIMSVKEAPPE